MENFIEKNYDEAIIKFTEAIGEEPLNAKIYWHRAGAFSAKKDYKNAFEDSKKCVELDPKDIEGYVRKGLN